MTDTKLSTLIAQYTAGGGGGGGFKNYFAASGASNTASGWTSSGSQTGVTTNTLANLPEPSVGSALLITLGAIADKTVARWTVDPSDYNAPNVILKAAVKALSGYAGGNAKLELYSNTLANYTGTSTRIPLTTDVSGVSGISLAQNYNGNYSNPGAAAPYMELRVVTVVATGALGMSSIGTGPGQAMQGNPGPGPWIAYTPVTQGMGTPTVNYCERRTNGENIEIRGRVTAGTPTAVALKIGMPTGFTARTVSGSDVFLTGTAGSSYAGTNCAGLVPIVQVGDTSSVQFGFNNTRDITSPITANSILVASSIFWFTASIPVNELVGAVTNLGQNAVEYAYNTSLTDANDTTSFGYGPQGNGFPSVTTSVKYKLVSFLSPIQPTDKLVVEVTGDSGATWWDATETAFTSITNNGGILVDVSSMTSTTARVYFAAGGTSQTIIASATAWSAFNTSQYKWRLRKTSAGVATGFGAASSAAPGLVSYENALVNQSKSFSGALAGSTAWSFARVGRVVTATMTAINSTTTANSNIIFAAGTIPAGFQPISEVRGMHSVNDSGTNTSGAYIVGTDGSVNFYPNASYGNWGSAAAIIVRGFTVSYVSA